MTFHEKRSSSSSLKFANTAILRLNLNCDIFNWNDETGVFQFVFRYPRPKMPFTYVVNVYSDMSLSKGHLGSRGKHLKIN